METSDKAPAWLQIYGQAYWHQSAQICGDEVGLAALRDAIDKALKEENAEMMAFASDGEGYELKVFRGTHENLLGLPCHYTQKLGRTQWDNGYDYARQQFLPMIRSLQERLRKLEGASLKKDKLMETAEED